MLVIAAVLAAYGAGVATGWRVADRRVPPRPEPGRGPELFGVVEEVRRPSPGWLRVRLSCRPPERPDQKSPQSEYEGERRSVYLVHVHDETVVRVRAGGAGGLAEQQAVSVWWQGEVLASDPPQVRAVWVVTERQ